MIAKLIAHGPRPRGRRRAPLPRLSRYEVVGPDAQHRPAPRASRPPAFPRRRTRYRASSRAHAADLLPPAGACPGRLRRRGRPRSCSTSARARGRSPPIRARPGARATAWRLNGDGWQDFHLRDGESDARAARAPARRRRLPLELPDGGRGRATETARRARSCSGWRHQSPARASPRRRRHRLPSRGRTHLRVLDPRAPPRCACRGAAGSSPPCRAACWKFWSRPGDAVARGAVLLVLEAMKVQMRITAPADGHRRRRHARVGDWWRTAPNSSTLDGAGG
jgi:3-methylcrotonyl-CoA carboxylase alpha subunit